MRCVSFLCVGSSESHAPRADTYLSSACPLQAGEIGEMKDGIPDGAQLPGPVHRNPTYRPRYRRYVGPFPVPEVWLWGSCVPAAWSCALWAGLLGFYHVICLPEVYVVILVFHDLF